LQATNAVHVGDTISEETTKGTRNGSSREENGDTAGDVLPTIPKGEIEGDLHHASD
jgi:hypothetical protein